MLRPSTFLSALSQFGSRTRPILAGLACSLVFSGAVVAEDGEATAESTATEAAAPETAEAGSAVRLEVDFVTGLNDPVVGFINERIRIGWRDNEVTPSPLADDAEWLRRLSLDLIGRVPTREEVNGFVLSKDEGKRYKVIDELIARPEFIEHFATEWTNILIGRQTPDRTNRGALHKFLRDSVALNRPWKAIVNDMLTAEGNFEENGAVNFLLAKLDGNPRSEDYHVEATASTARIFLGLQVQCTQCHNHPFNDWQQNQFWEFNSFLRNIRRNDVDDSNGDDLYSELVSDIDHRGPVFYEKRSGLMQVAYPTYFGNTLDLKGEEYGDVDRRGAFAAYVTSGADGENLLAKAFVNRTWSQLFGYGFTRPIDDMGPHNPASHPALLDRLADEFVAADYDIRKLIRWIANSEAYNLTSMYNRDGSNSYDNPAAGEVALFSHMYVKGMSAEQLYDSLIAATGAETGGDRQRAAQQRQAWLNDFLRIFGGNDEDEPTLFNGSIPQALLMMNGELVNAALAGEGDNVFKRVLNDSSLRGDEDRVNQLYVAALGRRPTRKESSAFVGALKSAAGEQKLWIYQDIYWALLNSNEFIFNH